MRENQGVLFGFLMLAAFSLPSIWVHGQAPGPEPQASRPPVAGQVTFLYYEDLDAAARFYGETLGLPKTLDLDWVKMFELSTTSKVGLVNATGGTHRPSDNKPVMVSLVVEAPEQVDAWHAFLRSRGVEPTSDPHDSERSGVRAFGFTDPEGYTLEVFAWLDQ